eukprot:TRINITY_DN16359_c0_g1_i1.p2 TRINITY_DN16359_c0_g1~~TRINITY_DN16359_c0_g1_i1.p2  ORF type:complete len:387 (-),score=-3.72 TRINITY_DN16359_c0_g1_i1:218-1276(-)
MNGIGPSLTSSRSIISNNDVSGNWELINLYRGTIGVRVVNNFLHDYIFAGFRCGADVHYAWDCFFTTLRHNFIYTPQSKGRLMLDAGGIYFCTHWYNPGNKVSCNYVIGGDHCYYLDYCTSAVEIDGGVCAMLWDGVKLNNGKRNLIRSLITVGLGSISSYITCLTVTINHCKKDPGNYWERMRLRYYNSPAIQKFWPWYADLCQQTSINGHSCNPKGPKALTAKETGACSGLPTENDVEVIIVDPDTPKPNEYRYCERNPGVENLNRQVEIRMSSQEIKFLDNAKSDYGVRGDSPIYKKRPKFNSCPRGHVGIKPMSVQQYYKDWNIGRPSFFNRMVAQSFNVIFDKSLIA